MGDAPDSAAPRILVVGSINVDLVAHVDRLPAPGETVAGGTLERTGGGKGANQAVAAARAGAAVALVGAIGDDDLGAVALDELRAEGIDVSAVRRLADTATGVALIAVDRDGNNQIAVASGANHALEPAPVEPALAALSEGPGCVLASFELTDELVLAAARAASAAGRTLVVSPAPARPLPPALCDARPILVPNQHEAAELAGAEDPEDAARRLTALTGAPVVVTLGARGALVLDADGAAHLPAPDVRVIDTTGAGDTFTGVLTAALAFGADIRSAARLAIRAAALSVGVAGARGGMPDRPALEAAGGER